MSPSPATPRRSAPVRSRTRPKSERAPTQSEKATLGSMSSEPPKKKLRYIPGGPGGGGRYVDEDGTEIPVGGTGPGGYNYIGPRGRIGRENLANGVQPVVYNRQNRTPRTRTVIPRAQPPPMRFTSAAQAAAAVQNDGYKPREERAWEEFHPNLDIESPLRAFSADEIEGIQSRPHTPAGAPASADGSIEGANGLHTPNGIEGSQTKSEGNVTPSASANGEPILMMGIPGTPGGGKRRPGRPPKDPIAFYAKRAEQLGIGLNIGTPKAPNIRPPVQNTNPKEKLTLPQPSYRISNTLARFEDQVRYVDKSMANVGYQMSDIFIRPEGRLIKASDINLDEDFDLVPDVKENSLGVGSGSVGRVEYDMDLQDDKWLEAYNFERKASGSEAITREMFEITITTIEKEWYALERRIPKPNPKPPQTHRPRSSSAAAVNGEPQAGEEQDSKCAICDDGDCENTNAIVFCDGCDLAVHQECYGVPFIPEGQWLCRKCQLIGRGIPTCIFCPNTDGAFKQTNASKWAHLLCAMWIPEVSLGNHTFMEPVMEVEKVPKTRWKLTCYICNQRMGACIQCGNKACYQAFHVTCARKARLFLKMKNSHGTLSVLDGTTVLKAFCDKHCPSDYAKENDVAQAIRDAKSFYRRTMRGRLWADSQASASALAATHRNAITEHQPDESQLMGADAEAALGDGKKKGNQPPKAVWKLPSGAPVIPQITFNTVESALQRFPVLKRKEYVADVCRYWTLKREARRGAALLKRLQLQDSFSSMELPRRNFAAMGPAGRPRLERRIEFADNMVKELERVKSLVEDIVAREKTKLEMSELEAELIDAIYFPIAKLLPPIMDKALVLDIKTFFTEGLTKIRSKLQQRFYTTILPFARDLSAVFSAGIGSEPPANPEAEVDTTSSPKKQTGDIKERKKLAKRIIKAIQPQLEVALRAEVEISGEPAEEQLKELKNLLEGSLEARQGSVSVSLGESGSQEDAEGDVVMTDAAHAKQNGIGQGGTDTSKSHDEDSNQKREADDVQMEDVDAPHEEEENIIVAVSSESTANAEPNGDTITTAALAEVNINKSPAKAQPTNGLKNTNASLDTSGHVSAPQVEQPNTAIQPVSNGYTNAEQGEKTLTDGGIPLFLKEDFQIEGVKVSEIVRESTRPSEELSEMDDDQLNDLENDYNNAANEETVAVIPVTKSKKAKSRKRR